jgi:ketosteroid isomerase-like protein
MVSASTAAPVSVAKPSLPGKAEEPAVMVKQWELAMQSRDAGAQTAFYANTVSRYFLRSKVGRDGVLADKQAAIANRKDGWTFKTERVKVERSGDSAATVMLVKHFNVEKDGATATEWFIPSQLKLTREDGQWRIVSERDLGWATSLDDLDG